MSNLSWKIACILPAKHDTEMLKTCRHIFWSIWPWLCLAYLSPVWSAYCVMQRKCCWKLLQWAYICISSTCWRGKAIVAINRTMEVWSNALFVSASGLRSIRVQWIVEPATSEAFAQACSSEIYHFARPCIWYLAQEPFQQRIDAMLLIADDR